MGLSYCAECQTIEGDWDAPNRETCQELGIVYDEEPDIDGLQCSECGSVGSYESIPEHDDYDMDR